MLALWRNDLGSALDLFDRMRREMDRLSWDLDAGFTGMPRVTLAEKDDEIVVRAEVPGFAQKDLEISLDRGVLVIRGERKKEEKEDRKVLHRERGSLAFSHSCTLPCKVDGAGATASLKDGVMEIRLPKAEEEKPRRIAVASA